MTSGEKGPVVPTLLHSSRTPPADAIEGTSRIQSLSLRSTKPPLETPCPDAIVKYDGMAQAASGGVDVDVRSASSRARRSSTRRRVAPESIPRLLASWKA